MKIQKLGLVGGSGPESTLIYYKEINRKINELSGETCFPEFTVESINLYRFSEFRVKEDRASMKSYLKEKLENLHGAGCEIAALTAGTLHMVYDELAAESPIPLISIPAAVSRVAEEKGYRKLGLLGTDVTMRRDFLKKDFIARGMEVFTPDEKEMDLVNARIFGELELGIVKESTRRELQEIISGMQKKYGIEAVILGCTELPLILNNENSPLPVLDIMQIHIDEIVKTIVEEI